MESGRGTAHQTPQGPDRKICVEYHGMGYSVFPILKTGSFSKKTDAFLGKIRALDG